MAVACSLSLTNPVRVLDACCSNHSRKVPEIMLSSISGCPTSSMLNATPAMSAKLPSSSPLCFKRGSSIVAVPSSAMPSCRFACPLEVSRRDAAPTLPLRRVPRALACNAQCWGTLRVDLRRRTTAADVGAGARAAAAKDGAHACARGPPSNRARAD
eukprot:scaffold1_cov402-Prasinococcus_capsulatus_cf.AAC.33